MSMIHQAEKLYEQLVEQLREAETISTPTPAQRQEASLRHIRVALQELKELVIHHTFPEEQEEIRFFRHVKPRFTSLLIYHSRLALIELKKPVGSLQDTRRYLENELLLIRIFYEHHVQLYQYLLTGATYLDTKLFVRGNTDLPPDFSTCSVDTDTRFTTHYDYVVARMQANERLRSYLVQALRDLEKGQFDSIPDLRKALVWTGSKVHLIELAYALCESGQINGGTTGVLEIAERLEELFQLKLGSVYRTFQEMRQRKKDSRTKFLDLMQEKLLHRMDELDAA
ncbi:RteC domain-containing protein [Pontibacter sp. MBLB2868]|uniref:RteC domain-containing protein n=1 Tax=Pontibacter sp. MBLB2868 TaxID=3451555 RepID=UPI003F75037B